MTFWTDERVEELKALFEHGVTAGQIKREMQAPSRNAVLGKLHRLGLHRDVTERGEQTRKGIASAGPRKPRQPRPRAAAVSAPAPSPAAPPRAPAPAQPCSLLKLTNESCRWPISDAPPHTFCGAREADFRSGVPYCCWHTRMAYTAR